MASIDSNRSEPKKESAPRRIHHPVIYVFSVVILVIIVVTFIGTPAITTESGPGQLVFGYFRNIPISFAPGNYFDQQRQSIADQIRETAAQASVEYQIYTVWRGAFDRTVLHTALVTEAEASGAYVSAARVDEALTRHPRYFDGGEFSEKRYLQTSAAERFQIRGQTRDDLIFQDYLGDHFDVRAPKAEIEFFKAMTGPERNFLYAVFPFASYPDSAVAAFGASDPAKFQRIKLSAITITTSKADADKVLAQAKADTASFDELAKTHSRDAASERGGDLGWRYYFDLERVVKNAADLKQIFSLEQGALTSVIETNDGWTFYRCDEPTVAPDFTDSDMLKTTRDYMNSFERGKIEDYMVGQAASFKTTAESAASFDAAALRFGVEVNESGFFPINYGNSMFLKPVSQSGVLSAAAFRERFFETAFTLAEKEISDPIVLNEAVVVLRLIEERPADTSAAEILDAYFPLVLRQFQEEDLRRAVSQSSLLKDEFDEAFVKYLLPQER